MRRMANYDRFILCAIYSFATHLVVLGLSLFIKRFTYYWRERSKWKSTTKCSYSSYDINLWRHLAGLVIGSKQRVGEMALVFQGNRSSTSETTSAKIKTYYVLESPRSSGALKGIEQESTNFFWRGLNTKYFLLCEPYHLKCSTKTGTVWKLNGLTNLTGGP